MNTILERNLKNLAAKSGFTHEFARTILAATQQIDTPNSVADELLTVSKLPYVRDLVGLGVARPQAKEPAWAAERLRESETQ
jgi:hypothetical protein